MAIIYLLIVHSGNNRLFFFFPFQNVYFTWKPNSQFPERLMTYKPVWKLKKDIQKFGS